MQQVVDRPEVKPNSNETARYGLCQRKRISQPPIRFLTTKSNRLWAFAQAWLYRLAATLS